MLHEAGAAAIDAIEANVLAFVRCLVVKETLRLDRARFHLGDFMKWLEAAPARYDLVVASGVLYHSHDPVRLLELICEKADAVFLWTHYFDEDEMPRGDLRRTPFSEQVEIRDCRGIAVRLHERSYYRAWRDPALLRRPAGSPLLGRPQGHPGAARRLRLRPRDDRRRGARSPERAVVLGAGRTQPARGGCRNRDTHRK